VGWIKIASSSAECYWINVVSDTKPWRRDLRRRLKDWLSNIKYADKSKSASLLNLFTTPFLFRFFVPSCTFAFRTYKGLFFLGAGLPNISAVVAFVSFDFNFNFRHDIYKNSYFINVTTHGYTLQTKGLNSRYYYIKYD